MECGYGKKSAHCSDLSKSAQTTGYKPKSREIRMKTFETFEEVDDMKNCMKRPIVVQAKEMKEPCRVYSKEGDYAQGKVGDYLMRGVEGELYICDRGIFLKSYDFT